MLQPKRTKFRKQFKGRIHGTAKGGTLVQFGAYGMAARGNSPSKSREIRLAATRSAPTSSISRWFCTATASRCCSTPTPWATPR